MADPNIITQSDAQTIGWELAYRTADNQLDVWQRLLHQLERALRPESPCVPLLAAINEALFTLRRLPIPYLDLVVPVDREEAFRLSRAGVQLTFENLLRIQVILHDVVEQLGYHPAVIPVYGFWEGTQRGLTRAIPRIW